MIDSVRQSPIDEVFKKNASFYYLVPKYQREYIWGHNQWKDLYDDVTENDFGYFIGSIICISKSIDSFEKNPLELIDGQQRLTTLSLLLAAIYNRLLSYKSELDEDDMDELSSLRKTLICKGSPNGLILCPQIQNHNLDDFNAVMAENGLTKEAIEQKWRGNRKITSCYRYFISRLQDDLDHSENPIQKLLSIKERVSRAVLVKIEVGSHSQAYTLFESLNNRGTPLTAIDLMKNLILAKAEKVGMSCDECFNEWQRLLQNLTDDYSTQERFLRQYYNAFKSELNQPFKKDGEKRKDPLGYIATRSNLLSIYESLIQYDLPTFVRDIVDCSRIYSQFITFNNECQTEFSAALQNLNRIQGAPSYLLLMYLFKKQTELQLSNDGLKRVINLLTRFFVRRNVTDMPNTRDLTTIFMNIIAEIETQKLLGESLYEHLYSVLVEKSASDEMFKEKLQGNLYEENVGATRFILCALAQRYMTSETWTDLWAQNEYSRGRRVYQWTIEHIFPEGKNIPDSWVDMIAEGDRAKAQDIQQNYVHKLGNLTITRYNSTLSNLGFLEKRDRKTKEGLFVGYRNGLEINKEIALKERWTVDDIKKRTDALVEDLLSVYTL